MRILHEGFLAASRTEIIHLAGVFALVLCSFDFDFHLANGNKGSSHVFLLLKNRVVHFGRGITFARQGVAVTTGGVAAESNHRDGFYERLIRSRRF
jgi:hypothetical protein